MDLGSKLDLARFQTDLQIKSKDGKRLIWGAIRSKWLVLQPEELVRQLLIQQLIIEHGVNKNRIAVERGLSVNGLQKRCDILIYDEAMKPWLLVECKAPKIALRESVFRQIATYNMPLRVPYLLVCNGPNAYCCEIDFAKEDFTFLSQLPNWE